MTAGYFTAVVHSGDVRAILASEGLDVAMHRLRHAVKRGHVPTPVRTASGDFAWAVHEVPAIRNYFRNPVPQGRPKKVKT
jgi:hypothetical protein